MQFGIAPLTGGTASISFLVTSREWGRRKNRSKGRNVGKAKGGSIHEEGRVARDSHIFGYRRLYIATDYNLCDYD